MSKEKFIPELRFPEFRDDEEWKKDSVDNLFYLQDGYPFSSFDFTRDKENSKQVIRITDINNQNNNDEKVYVSISRIKQLEISKYEVFKGDLLLSLTGAAGFNFFIWDAANSFINQRTMKISPKNQDNEALKFLLESLIHSKINFIGTGQNNNLSKDALREIDFPFPKPKEQRRLSSFITNLNDLIAAHTQKLDLLKDHKKSLMQNLFPQAGEKVPKVRFMEFEKDGEWVEKKLGEVATFSKGKGISKSDIIENGNLPCIRYGELYTHYTETINLIKSYTNLSADELVLSEGNDVIIPASGETQIDIATASCVLGSGIALGGDLNIIRSEFDGAFLAYYLNGVKKSDIAQLAQGISVVHLYPSQLQTLNISFPKNPKEQQKIASCLSSLDALITAQAEKIAQLKLHKKGLMQGLFPKIKE